MLDILSKKRAPSQIDHAKFMRSVSAVEHPESVFRAMEQGTLSKEGVEALQAVYPNLYEKLQSKVLEHVSSHPNLPYKKKLQLGLLLNVPTDESLLPENVLALQALFGQQQPDAGSDNAQTATKATPQGIKNIDIAGRAATDTQKLDEA